MLSFIQQQRGWLFIAFIILMFFALATGAQSQNTIKQTEFYKKLASKPGFKPCDPIGCGIENKIANPTPICGRDGKCRPCMRDGECVMAYRTYLNKFYEGARCNDHTGDCETGDATPTRRRLGRSFDKMNKTFKQKKTLSRKAKEQKDEMTK